MEGNKLGDKFAHNRGKQPPPRSPSFHSALLLFFITAFLISNSISYNTVKNFKFTILRAAAESQGMLSKIKRGLVYLYALGRE